MGIYIFNKDVMIKFIEGLDYIDFGKEILLKLVKDYSF